MRAPKTRIFFHLALVALLFGAANLFADEILLRNGIIHTVSGETITNGAVVINDDKIEQVLTNADEAVLKQPAKTVDLKGQHLYPGLIALDTASGLEEIEAVRATQDTTEVGDYTPDVQSWIAVNPDSELLPVARANGIGYIEPAPQGGVVAGTSGLLKLDGWTTEQMLVKHPAALHLYWPEMGLDTRPREKFRNKEKYKSLEDQALERRKKMKALEEFFLEARAYARQRDAIAGGKLPDSGINPPWEAMLPVVRGEIPIMVHAADLRQIKAAVKWSQTNNFKIVLVGGRDASQAADLLAAAKVPVLYESTFETPNRDYDAYDVNFKAAEILRRAGVKVAFSIGPASFNAALTKNLPYLAAQSAAFGLPEREAVRGLTLYPAQMLGVDQRLGSIEVGKEATFFANDGDVLDIRSNVKQMWIAGREVSLESRHTRLYEKYKNRPLPK